MATRLLLSVLLLCSLAAVSAAEADITIAGGKPWPWNPDCRPGHAVPMYALPRCRAYVKRACTGDEVPAEVLRQCCHQVDTSCGCAAVYLMMGSLYRELDVAKGQVEAFPGCRRNALKQMAAGIPLTCGRLYDDESRTCSAVLRDY